MTIESKFFEALVKVNLIPKNYEIKDLDYSSAGRTDKKVSSSGNVICLKLKIKEKEFENLSSRINSALPDDIVIFGVCEVPDKFSARFDCLSREYRYFFFLENLDLELIQKAAKTFEGKHDFKNFCKMKPEYEKEEGTVRVVEKCEIKLYRDNIKNKDFLPMGVFICKGNGFLYHQIRCMISIIKIIGRGDYGLDLIHSMLDVNNKLKFVFNMDDPENLLFYNCEYDKEIVNFNIPNKRCEKFISKFFSFQYQKCITNYNLVSNIKSSFEEVIKKKFTVVKNEIQKPFKKIKLN